MMKRIYLDNAATTPIAPEVLEAMMPYLTEQFGNPSSPGQEGRIARLAVENARKKIAGLLHTSPSQLVFTSCGTEANNLALRGLIKAKKITRVISTRIEHSSVYNTLCDLTWQGQIEFVQLNVDREGRPDLKELESYLADGHGHTMVSLMHANNEIGTMIDLWEVGTICSRYKTFFHSDTVQTMGHFPMNLSEIPVDLMTMSAHKFHGPKGVGMLWMRKDLGLQVIQTGGSHENGMRAGTENVAGIVGMAKAFEMAMQYYQQDSHHIQQLSTLLQEGLEKLGAIRHGSKNDQRLYTVLNMGLPDIERSKHLLLELDIAGISVSAGSACNSGKTSKVMAAIHADQMINIRFSFSRYNQLPQINRVLDIIQYQLIGESITAENPLV